MTLLNESNSEIIIPARFCPLCQQRLANLNRGIHCFRCADMAAARAVNLSASKMHSLSKPKKHPKVKPFLVTPEMAGRRHNGAPAECRDIER